MTEKIQIKSSLILMGKGLTPTGYSEATNRYSYDITPEALAKIKDKHTLRKIEIVNK